MGPEEFLDTVWPSSGFVCLVRLLENGGLKPEFFENRSAGIEAARGYIDRYDNRNDLFFGVHGFSLARRKGEDASSCRSFFLDVDGKDYEKDLNEEPPPGYGKQLALDALGDFLTNSGIVAPTIIVDSGNGYHVYWVLTDDIPPDEWRVHANNLKRFASADKIRVDHHRTSDTASILRLVGSTNKKRKNAAPLVEVIYSGEPVVLTGFAESIRGGLEPSRGATSLFSKAPVHAIRSTDEVTDKLRGDREYSAVKILERSLDGNGCDIIRDAFIDQGSVPEPIWQGIISVFSYCEDGNESAHAISCEHPEYSPEETDKKYEHAVGNRLNGFGPRTCSWFGGHAKRVCESCPSHGKISTPLQLGSEVKSISDTELPTDTDFHDEGMHVHSGDVDRAATGVNGTHTGINGIDLRRIPLPKGYFFGQSGAVYFKRKVSGKDDTTIEEDIEIYPNPCYVTEHYAVGESRGMHVKIAVLPPHTSKPHEFIASNADLASPDKFRSVLSENHFVIDDDQHKLLRKYIQKSIHMVQHRRRASRAYDRMGWVSNDDAESKEGIQNNPQSFIYGDYLYTPDGQVQPAELNNKAKKFARLLKAFGDETTFNRIKTIYERDQFRPLHPIIALGLGAPIVALVKWDTVWVDIYSQASGSGKTTLYQFIIGCYGNPSTDEGIGMLAKDTPNSRQNRLGTLSAFPTGPDEMTTVDGEAVAKEVFDITHNRGAHRMKNSVNEERDNELFWHTVYVTTANQSMAAKCRGHRISAEGEIMRMVSFRMPTLIRKGDWTSDSLLLDQIRNNYGFLGHRFVRLIVQMQSHIMDFLTSEMARLQETYNFDATERYWLKSVTIATVTATLLRDSQLMAIDPEIVEYEFMRKGGIISRMRQAREEYQRAEATVLSDYILGNIRNTLVFPDTDKVAGLVPAHERIFGNEILIRVEQYSGYMFIDKLKYMMYLTKLGVDHDQHFERLREARIEVEEVYKGMGEFTSTPSPPKPAIRLRIEDIPNAGDIINQANKGGPDEEQ